MDLPLVRFPRMQGACVKDCRTDSRNFCKQCASMVDHASLLTGSYQPLIQGSKIHRHYTWDGLQRSARNCLLCGLLNCNAPRGVNYTRQNSDFLFASVDESWARQIDESWTSPDNNPLFASIDESWVRQIDECRTRQNKDHLFVDIVDYERFLAPLSGWRAPTLCIGLSQLGEKDISIETRKS